MTEGHLHLLLTNGEAKLGSDGWQNLGAGQLLTLYVAHGSVGLTVAKIESLKLTQGLMHARTQKGELFVLALEDVFAGSVDGVPGNKRKAGFV